MTLIFHLRDTFKYERQGDEVVLHAGLMTTRVPVAEWASAVAATSARGETSESYQEALEFLDRD